MGTYPLDKITFKLFDHRRKYVYLDGQFIGWLSTSQGQASPFIFSRSGYAFTGNTAEEAIEAWFKAGCPKE